MAEQVTRPQVVLEGRAGAPGRVSAPARVVRARADLVHLCEGEVLVCPTTSVDHDEALARAAALVTDVGAADGHSATRARELGIPAVLGTGIATRRITDGMVVEVDGDTGTVALPEGSEPIPTGFKPKMPYKFAIGAGAVLLAAVVARLR